MLSRKLSYFLSLIALTMLSIAGCSGGGSSNNAVSQKGYTVSVSGKVEGGKSLLKTLFAAAPDLGTITVINGQDGTVLGSGPIDANGAFKSVSLTLPTAKATLVFKADVSLAGTPFRNIVPIDLSTPPAPGISASNSVNINISQDTTNIAITVSTMLGLTGILGDTGQTLNSVNKTYADAAAQVVANGGQVLAYNTSGLTLTGSLTNGALLPAVDASTFSVNDLNNITLDGQIQSVFIPAKKPIVNFTVVNKATGKGITGLRTFALHIAKLMPEVNGSNSFWQNYISAGLPLSAIPARGTSALTNPSADSADLYVNGVKTADGYKIIDHGDGSYTATFGADITANVNIAYDATLTHRLGISIRNVNVPGGYAGPINPLTGAVQAVFTSPNVANIFYDFTPSTGLMLTDATTGKQAFARDIVTAGACGQCHYKLALAVPNNFLSGHTGSRTDSRLCVMCHTNQISGGEGEFVTFIHRIHMGETLNDGGSFKPIPKGLVTYGEQTYPQDIRNCTLCHQGKDVSNWMTKPSRKSCGSCHNATDFATHQGGQANDQLCSSCHGSAIVSLKHLPIAPPATDNAVSRAFAGYSNATAQGVTINSNTNASYTAAASLSRLPAGAKAISYVIKSVSRNTSKQPVMEFKFQVATADANGVLGAPVDIAFNDPALSPELLAGFVGSPSIYFAFAVPQDGITAPVDYNATASAYLKRLWNGTATSVNQPTQAGTLTGPVSGYYTVTLTNVNVPDNAVMMTGGIGYTYGLGSYSKGSYAGTAPYVPFITTTQPLTQTDLAAYPYVVTKNGVTLPIGEGGFSVPSDNKWKLATGYTARRVIVDNAKCNACHGRLGVNPTFHAGQRNDAPTCTFCHNVNRTNSGWAVNSKDIIHSIHGAGKRVNKFSWESSAGAAYWQVTYPGLLRNCEECHVAGMYDFSNSVYTANNNGIFDSMLYTTVASGNIPSPISVVITGNEPIPGTYYSPFVTAGTKYGATFAFNSGAPGMPNSTITKADGTKVTLPPQGTFQAETTTLVNSPIAAACAACHDTKYARGHMATNGGSISEPRSTALGKQELCVVCHGISNNNLNSTVPNIKAVHRWW